MPKPPIELNPDIPPWERQVGENSRWFGRFQAYRLMGSKRSVLGLYKQESEEKVRKSQKKSEKKQPVSAPGPWYEVFERFRWKERAEAWDIQRRLEAEKEEQIEWLNRRRSLRSREWQHSDRLIEKAQAMLAEPLHTAKEDDDGNTVKIPAKWSFRDAATLIQLACALRRSATGSEVKELEAITVLVEAGWLPASILYVTADRFFEMKAKVQEAFKASLVVFEHDES